MEIPHKDLVFVNFTVACQPNLSAVSLFDAVRSSCVRSMLLTVLILKPAHDVFVLEKCRMIGVPPYNYISREIKSSQLINYKSSNDE